jgi:uncharacterized protein YdhG (YjbR/CyaY superfamily)
MAGTKTPTKKLVDAKKANIWSDEERAAMQASATERKTHAKLSPAEERAVGEAEVLAKLADMPPVDRAMGERIHELVTRAVPSLNPKTYYGMPAYAKDGKVICFYKPKSKFKVRYSTFEFQPDARLDDGEFWAVSFAVDRLTPKAEERIVALVKQAAS